MPLTSGSAHLFVVGIPLIAVEAVLRLVRGGQRTGNRNQSTFPAVAAVIVRAPAAAYHLAFSRVSAYLQASTYVKSVICTSTYNENFCWQVLWVRQW